MRMSSTEAARSFSDVLSRVASGETIEIDRHGNVVAVMVPPRKRSIDAGELIDLVRSAPSPGQGFADDVEGLSSVLGQARDPWES